jgi:hypothetical protein
MDALWPALIVAVPAFVGPWIAIRANGRERRKDQELTWRRDDQVALQAAEAARLLLNAQRESIARTDEVARHAATANRATSAKLDTIHTLVNQKLTTVTEQALTATVALLEALESTEAVQQRHGEPMPPQTAARIGRARAEVAALRGTLAERREQQAEVDAESIGHVLDDDPN